MQEEKISKEEAESLMEKHLGAGTMFEAYEKKIHKLKNLIEIAKIINSSMEKKSLLDAILLSCQGQFFISYAAIFLYDELDAVYHLESYLGLDDLPSITVIPETDPFISHLNADLEYLKVNKDFKIKDLPLFCAMNKELKADVIFPLKVKNKLNGFITVGTKMDGQELIYDEITYMKNFADLASVSVENMILFQLVALDRMTKLYTHHYFQTRLDEEMNRAVRYNHNLTLIMLDIDHFKNFNDTYGHLEGDRILINLAELLKNSVRNTDIVARYGGEEFTIILTESDMEKGIHVAEKIRKEVEDYDFSNNPKRNYKVTVSIGIAAYKKDLINTPFKLIQYADRSLYHSKEQGRNKVTAYSELDEIDPDNSQK